MIEYDCTADVMEHKRKVEYWARDFVHWFESRIRQHDNSKLLPPEKAIFDEYTPKLKDMEFGSDEYKAALVGMGDGLKHHYEMNAHHPEHFKNGVSGMTLIDLVEMFCDWLAAAENKKTSIDIDYLALRFNISPQLVDILVNTMRATDFWCEVNGVPVIYFTPEDRRINND